MNKMIRTAAAGVALFAAMGASSAAYAQDATADATAEVLEALTLTNDEALDFGTIVLNANSNGGTVVVTAAGSRSCTVDVICGPGGAEQAAEFTVTGAANTDVNIILPDLNNVDVVLTHENHTGSTDPEHNIEVTAFSDSASGGYTGFSGNETFGVGGTINLGGDEIAGIYNGSFDVSVEYQ